MQKRWPLEDPFAAPFEAEGKQGKQGKQGKREKELEGSQV